jgi:PIN domain nuclease of toxin-antitoxin system
MKILIDTQVFIWLVSDQPRLGTKTLQAISDTSNQVCMSYFSFLEMTLKASNGKLDYDHSVLDDLPTMGIDLFMPSTDLLRGYRVFNPDNKDPFDNLLIATALAEKCTFATSDQKILAVTSKRLKLLDATK